MNMRRAVLGAVILSAVALGACGSESATVTAPEEAGLLHGKGPSNVNVTSTIADADTGVAPALQYQSDGLGSYSNASNLTSQIQSVGDWVLDMYTVSRATRQVYLDFSQPIAGSGPNGGDPVVIPSGLYKVRIISKCSLFGNNYLTLAPGATVPCPLHVKFDYNGSSWALEMNPIHSSGDPEGASETNYANVTCVNPASGSGACVGWKVTPSAPTNEARLIHYVVTKGQTQSVNDGDYDIAFSISVTNP